MPEYDNQIDQICDSFEEAWRSGDRPSIFEYVCQSDSAVRLPLLENLIPLDVEYRSKLGEAIETSDYAALGPEAIAIAETELQRNLDRLAESKNEGDSDDGVQALPSDLPGSQIGPYKLVEKIGEGGMGSVWLAEQMYPVRRSVALKLSRSFLVPRNLSQSQQAEFQKRLDELANRFESERQTQAVMDHPNIAKVLDAGTTDDKRPYFVMELVDGSPINEYCDNVRATIRQRIDLMIQACKAIQHAHQKGIIHRDIKPSNVLVTTQDDQPIVKVIDFGLAKVTSEADKLLGAATPTQTGMIMGTYLYMSPEQAGTNTKDIDTRSDVYSLGVLLFELLTGSTPIDRTRANELIDLQLLAAIREEEPPRPSDRLSKLHDSGLSISSNRQTEVRKLSSILRGELDWIALKALAKDRKRRYDGPIQLAEDLQRYLDGEAIVARPPSVSYRLRKTLRKHRIAVGVTALALTLITAGFIATYSQLQRAIVAEKASSENAEKEREQRETAENNLARATKAETETQERVKELEELTQFQESQFLNVEVHEMAMNLRQQLLDEYRQSIEGSSEAQQAKFEQSIAGLNLVDLSRGFLEQNVITPATKAALERYANQPKFQASILNAIAVTADRIGLPAISLPLVAEAVQIRREVLGNEHPDTFASIIDMSGILFKQGKLSEAEPLQRAALVGCRTTLGNEHPITLNAMNNMAMLLEHQGKMSEAELLLREVLDTSRKVLTNEHPNTLTAINNMALLNVRIGKIREAELLHREALDNRRRILGDQHPETLNSTLNMALLLAHQGKWSEAESLHREALDTSRKILGKEHPSTLTALDFMAVLLDRLGRWSESEPLHIEALDIRRRVLGNEHPETIGSIEHLADFFSDNKKLKEAEPLYHEVLNARRKLLGNEHPMTLTAIHNLAVCRDKRLGKWGEVEALYREALEGRRELLGNTHADTLYSISDFARSLHLRHKFDEAELLYREYMNAPHQISIAVRRARVQIRLGKLLVQTKRNSDEAKQLIVEGYTKLNEEIENIEPSSRQRFLDEAEAAMKLIEAPE